MHIELQSCTTTDTTDNLKSVCRTKLDPAQAAEKTPPACAPALHSKVHCLMLYKQTHAHGDTMPLVFVHGCVRLSTPHNVLLHEPTFFHSDLSYQRTTSISRVVVHAHKKGRCVQVAAGPECYNSTCTRRSNHLGQLGVVGVLMTSLDT